LKHNPDTLPPAYESVESRLLALFYSGVYITNAEIVEVAGELGLELPMKERTALLKHLMRHAHDNGETPRMLKCFITLLKKRVLAYQALVQSFPEASDIAGEWIQKANSTILLLQREMRSGPYE